MAGDRAFLAGDLNSKVENANGRVIARSSNGKLLADSVYYQNLTFLNFDDRCHGKWTHVIRTTGASSVIDYVAISTEIERSVKNV